MSVAEILLNQALEDRLNPDVIFAQRFTIQSDSEKFVVCHASSAVLKGHIQGVFKPQAINVLSFLKTVENSFL